jgi:hypothetical protein
MIWLKRLRFLLTDLNVTEKIETWLRWLWWGVILYVKDDMNIRQKWYGV